MNICIRCRKPGSASTSRNQAGQIMAAVALLERNPEPGDDDIDRAMTNIRRRGVTLVKAPKSVPCLWLSRQ